MDALERQIESIAADLVMVSTDDPPAMAALHEKIMEFTRIIGNETDSLFKAGKATADYLERIVLKEVDDEASAMQVMNDSISALQAVIVGKRDFSEVSFPSDLKLDLAADGQSPEGETGSPGNRPADEGKTGEAAESSGSVNEPTANTSQSGDIEEQTYVFNFDNADHSLTGEFITEAREHCSIAEQMMMDLETGDDPDSAINAIFRSFHTIKGAAGFLELQPVLVLAHVSETLLDMARKGTIEISGLIADTVFDTIDTLRALFDCIQENLDNQEEIDVTGSISGVLTKLTNIIAANPEQPKDSDKETGEKRDEETLSDKAPERIGEILVKSGEISQGDIVDVLGLQRNSGIEEKTGNLLVREKKVPPRKVAHALRDQAAHTGRKAERTTSSIKEVVKIDTERLDGLLDTIGELVIAESMVGQDDEILALDSPHISRNISHLNKITRELQEMGMAMRLVPVKPTFQKLSRAVRDLTRKAGKHINLVLSGEDTEVDRSIVENIGDPLMHMVRNSVDHGIESPEERRDAGKPETGTINLRAYHKGGNLYFDIEDDGKGLDKDRILAKAQEKGLIDPGKEMTDKDIYNLIFLPGFSTAREITEISGRGVGMDVVKRNVEAMRGHLEVDSVPGRGTRFSMKLPLTLAIIDGMLVSVRGEKLIVPTLSVVESLRLTRGMVFSVEDRAEMINLRGNLLPLVRVSDLLGFSIGDDLSDTNETVVVVEDSSNRAGLVIDELLGQRQVVIKSLGPVFEDQKWVSGGAILSNGRIGLIIDVNGIINLAQTSGLTRSISRQNSITEQSEVDGGLPAEEGCEKNPEDSFPLEDEPDPAADRVPAVN